MRNLIICLLLAVVAGYGATIFGPVSYNRTTSAPNVYDTTFAAYDTTVLCTLVVTNGDADGEHRLSAASIEFNGEEIVKERDFSESVETIMRVLQLTSENSLHLRLRSGPGDFLTLNIHRQCDANVSLAVDTIIEGEACFTAEAGGWGELIYDWDFDGDGETDTTTAENTICHTYEEADTYWASVRVEDEVGCTAEDSVEVVIELGYNYTFEIDSSYIPWSYTFPATVTNLSVADASDDGRVVALASSESPGAQYKDYYIFVEGELTHTFENVHKVFISHSGNRLLMKPRTPWDDVDWAGGRIYCFTSMGDSLWGPYQYSRFDPVWSSDDSLIGLFTGEGDLNDMPGRIDYFSNEVELDVTRLLRIADAENGELSDEIPIDKHRILLLGTFRKDMGGFILYKTVCDNLIWAPVSENDTLEIYDSRNGYFSLVNKITTPLEPPAIDSLHARTCLTGTYAMFDHRIYLSWGWKPKVPDPDGYFTQYVCLDSLGNLIWHDYDTTRAHARYYSESGQYLLEFDIASPGYLALRETATNDLLFEKVYPEDGKLFLAGVLEYPETGDCLVFAVGSDGNGALFYPDGNPVDFEMQGLTLTDNPSFAYRMVGSTMSFYKIRW